MRDLSELEMYHIPAGSVPPLTAELVAQFERDFDVKLPEDYVKFLRYSNGGSSHLNWIDDEYSIDSFYSMVGRDTGALDLWYSKGILDWALADKEIPIASDGGELTYFLDCACEPPPVLCVSMEDVENPVKLADSFGEFLDLLQPSPHDDYLQG